MKKLIVFLTLVILFISCSKDEPEPELPNQFTIEGEVHEISGLYTYIGYEKIVGGRMYYSIVFLSDKDLDDIPSYRYSEIVHDQYCVKGATLIMFGRRLGTDAEFEYMNQLEDSTYATANNLSKYKPTFYINSNGKFYEKILDMTTINDNSYYKPLSYHIDFSGKLETGEKVTCYFVGNSGTTVIKK